LPFKKLSVALAFASCLACGFARHAWPAGSFQPPAVMHFCFAACFTLVLKDGRYVRVDGTPETWTIEVFTAERAILHRHDAPAAWNGNKDDVTYAGKVSNDRLIGISVAGSPPTNVALAWGSALGSVPANNEERDRRSSPPLDSTSSATAVAVLASAPEPSTREPPLMTRVPLKLNACDGEGSAQHCVVWTWTGTTYTEDAGTPTATPIEVYQWNADAVLLNESDSSSDVSYTYAFTGQLQGDGSVRGQMEVLAPGKSSLGQRHSISKSPWTVTLMSSTAPSYSQCDIRDAAAVQVSDAAQRGQAAFEAGDLVTGTCWARIGAAQGGRRSQSVYGFNLGRGRGVGRDIKQSFFWTEKAAQQHDYAALVNVATMYESGDGVQRDHAKALMWMEEAEFQKKIATIARSTPDQMLQSLAMGYIEQYTGILDQQYEACQQARAAGKPATEQCVNVEMRHRSEQEAARQRAYEDCRRKSPHPDADCRRT
jgi:Sel1 repeat